MKLIRQERKIDPMIYQVPEKIKHGRDAGRKKPGFLAGLNR
jgi:hypothetical protein